MYTLKLYDTTLMASKVHVTSKELSSVNTVHDKRELVQRVTLWDNPKLTLQL